MNKLGIVIFITGIVLLGILLGTNYLNGKKESATTENEGIQQDILDTEDDVENETTDQTEKIGGITFNTGLTLDSSESEIVDAMHLMTHQKVKADEKWGAIPMIPDTINQIYEIVENSNFKIKEELLEILERWKQEDFSKADKDHNYFWDYQNGTIGKAYGLMSKQEEALFIINNFGEEYLKE